MNTPFFYVIVWILLLVFPILTAAKRYWVAFSIFVIGSLLFLYMTLRNLDGWDDLAHFATLLVVVLPLYVVGIAVWTVSMFLRKSRSNGKR